MDFDIIVAGAGPAGLNFVNCLVNIQKDPIKFLKRFGPYLTSPVFRTLTDQSVDLKICLIKGTQPSNQFVSVWDEPYDELKPFGMRVKDFALHYTDTLEWEFPFTTFRYKSPYCSVDHLKILNKLESEIKGEVHIQNTELQNVSVSKEGSLLKCQDGTRFTAKVFVDACGYRSIINRDLKKNSSSPIYQMLVWKYPEIRGIDRNVNNIWYKPKVLYTNSRFDVNDKVAGWLHPLKDGYIIGASKYLFTPMSWKTLDRELTPYLEQYITIRKLKPEGEKMVFRGIGVLYNPEHRILKSRVLQLGDARRISRPCTGYGFIPSLWHGLFGASAAACAFINQRFSFMDLEWKTMSLFWHNFLFNYSFQYIMQNLYMLGDWASMEVIFKTVKDVMKNLDSGFIDRLTMTRFNHNDLDTGIPQFALRLLQHPKIFTSLPWRGQSRFCANLLINRVLRLNPTFR